MVTSKCHIHFTGRAFIIPNPAKPACAGAIVAREVVELYNPSLLSTSQRALAKLSLSLDLNRTWVAKHH